MTKFEATISMKVLLWFMIEVNVSSLNLDVTVRCSVSFGTLCCMHHCEVLHDLEMVKISYELNKVDTLKAMITST